MQDFITGLCPAGDRFRSLSPVEELSTGFHELTRHANANRVTIYALQTNGLRPSFLSTAEQASVDFLGANPFNRSIRESERGGMAGARKDEPESDSPSLIASSGAASGAARGSALVGES